MVGGDDQPAADAAVVAPGRAVAEVDEEERRHEDPREQVQRPVDAVAAGVLVVAREALFAHAERYTPGGARLPGALDQLPRAASRVGGSGVKASSGRASIASRASSSFDAVGAQLAEAGGLAAQLRGSRASMSRRLGADRRRQRAELVRRAGSHEGQRAGQDRGVGLGVGAAADPHQRLADHVVQAEGGGVDRVGAEQRALGEGGAVALARALRRARRRSARRRAARSSARPGWRSGV